MQTHKKSQEASQSASQDPSEKIEFTLLNGKDAFTIRKVFGPIRHEKNKRIENKETSWSKTRCGILKRLLLLKLNQHTHIKERLLSSGFRPITMLARGNFTWPSGDGEHVTGVALMHIRDDADATAVKE